MIEVVIPVNCFIMCHCGLIHCGILSWFIGRGEYFSNTRVMFTIFEKYFRLKNENTVIMDRELCSIGTCDVYKINK